MVDRGRQHIWEDLGRMEGRSAEQILSVSNSDVAAGGCWFRLKDMRAGLQPHDWAVACGHVISQAQ